VQGKGKDPLWEYMVMHQLRFGATDRPDKELIAKAATLYYRSEVLELTIGNWCARAQRRAWGLK
jgi:hypothetical protein